ARLSSSGRARNGVTAREAAMGDALIGALDAFGATVGAVYLRDPEHPVLRLAGARSKNAGDAPAWAAEVAWGKGVAGGAAAAGEPLTGVEHDRSTLAAPLLLGDDAIGALAVASGGARDFSGADAQAMLVRSRALARALAPPPLEALRSELAGRIPAPASQWLDTTTAAAARGEREAIVTSFPAVGRRLGREPLGSRSPLVRRDFDVEVPLRAWRIDDAGRVALLCAFAGDAEAPARELHFTGDLRETCRALRGPAMCRGLVGKLCGYLEHPAEAHRAAAARALGRIGDRRAEPFVRDRLAREDDRMVRRALERALA